MVPSSAGDHVTSRPPTEGDVPEPAGIKNACFVGYYAPHRFSQSHLTAYLRNERAICVVAAGSCSLLGYIAGYVKPEQTRSSARIESIRAPEPR